MKRVDACTLEALAHYQVEKMERTIEAMRSGRIDADTARVELDARKRIAAKLLPDFYGDRIDIEIAVRRHHRAPEAAPPIFANATRARDSKPYVFRRRELQEC